MSAKKNKKAAQLKSDASVQKGRNTLILVGIIMFTFLLFAKSIYYNFIGFDDPEYIVNNGLIRNLSINGLKDIFTTPVIGMYNPLTFVVYAIEYKLFGLSPSGYHFFNLLFHLIAVVLVFKFIYKLTGRYETASVVAILFAVHPMHVSVVTWLSQLKTSLCVVFYFSALISYLKYLQNGYKNKQLLFVNLFFVLALLSKPSAVTIPLMLFLIDYYFSRKINKQMIFEKTPLLIFSLGMGFLTLYTHAEDSIFSINKEYSLINNLLIANYSVVFYLEKIIFPFNLSAIYPYPESTIYLPLKYYLALPVIPLLFYLIIKTGAFRKELIFGLLFFIISISVVIRIVPAGFFSAANRYSYLSYTGLFFIIGQFITYTLDYKFSFSATVRKYVISGFFTLLAVFSLLTAIRISVWEDSISLFSDVISKYPKVPVAYSNRGYAKALLGDYHAAWVDLNTAIELDSMSIQAYLNRAITETALGKYDESKADLQKVIEMDPKCGAAYYDRGILKVALGDTLGAIEDYKKAQSLGLKEAKRQMELLQANFNRAD